MNEKDCFVEKWSKEYGQKGIPSSFKIDPSSAVLQFSEYLAQKNFPKGTLLDLGCGKGRNSLFIAERGFQVTSMDFVPENIAELAKKTKENQLLLTPLCHDLAKPFPLTSEKFDYAMDIFCFKHIIEEPARSNYRHELYRCLKPGALFLLSLASVEDGFYGPLLNSSPAPEKRIIIDPYTKIPSILYTETSAASEFSNGFELIESYEKRNTSLMHGKEYERVILSFIFKREKGLEQA